ncbi:NAD(P)-binding protein [Nonomuraea thailandensis]
MSKIDDVSRRGFLTATGALLGTAALGVHSPAARAAGPISSGAHVAALVIGTGYGGSVAALRLAEAGVNVHLIEMGQAWDTPGSDGRIFCNTREPDYRSYWLRTRTKAPLNYFLGFPIDRDIPATPASWTPRSSAASPSTRAAASAAAPWSTAAWRSPRNARTSPPCSPRSTPARCTAPTTRAPTPPSAWARSTRPGSTPRPATSTPGSAASTPSAPASRSCSCRTSTTGTT